jgi:hypothetical protein
MRRIGEIMGTCQHGVHILSGPCKACEDERPRFSRKEEVIPPDGISQLGEMIIQSFNQQLEGVKGFYPVWVGTKDELKKGLIKLELQRSWKDAYGNRSMPKLEIRMTVKSALPWWRRFFNSLFGGSRAHLAPRHGSQV